MRIRDQSLQPQTTQLHNTAAAAMKYLPMKLLTFLTFIGLSVSAQIPLSILDTLSRHTITANPITTTTTTTVTGPITPTASPSFCPQPCGVDNQICCASGLACVVKGQDEPQCLPVAPTLTPSGTITASLVTPSTPTTCNRVSSSSYVTISTVFSTSTTVVTFTHIQTDVQTIIGEVTWNVTPQPTDCCSPVPRECDASKGESQCGAICCASGQFCVSAGRCAAVGGAEVLSTNGVWSYGMATYMQDDVAAVTAA